MKTILSSLIFLVVLCGLAVAQPEGNPPDEPTPLAGATAAPVAAPPATPTMPAAEPEKPAAPETEAPGEASAEPKPATPPEQAETDPVGTVLQLVGHIKAGEWRLALALVLALLMFALARVRDKVKWFRGDRGGAVLVMVLALAGTVSTALASSATLDYKLLLGTLGLAWTAVGGYSWIKRLFWPKDDEPVETPSEG